MTDQHVYEGVAYSESEVLYAQEQIRSDPCLEGMSVGEYCKARRFAGHLGAVLKLVVYLTDGQRG
jgi:hypothetical protein